MKAWVCVLLGISLSLVSAQARATRLGEAAQRLGVASPPDTSCVSTSSTHSRDFPRWARRGNRIAELGELTPDRTALGGMFPRVLSGGIVPSSDPVIDQRLYGADGNVLGIARLGNTLFIAGSFRSVGENRGGCVPLDAHDGEVLASFPKVAGSVYAIVPDGTGGWYIGGEFSGVGGKPRSCLAQILADGSVSDWNPNVTGSPGYISPPAVLALALHGAKVFVGGDFRFIGGQPRMDLGSVDARTGAVLDWVADTPADGYVRALALQGDTLFVGGGFSSLGGAPRSSLAAVNAMTGEVLPWRMDVLGGAYSLLASADTLYVGGDFLSIAGRPQPILVAVDIPNATLLPIDFRASGITQDYVPSPQVAGLSKIGDTLYAVGNFTQIGGQSRAGIAALDATSGNALAWSPDSIGPRDGFPPPLCLSVAVSGGAVYVGGYFELVGDAFHPFVAAWDRQTGRVLDWAPRPDNAAYALATQGDTLYVGGEFHMVGEWQHRAGLAAIDLTTGRVIPWNPNPNGRICTTITVHGDRVLVSGDFSIIGGDPQPRNAFAALDTVNGEVVSWDPGANDLATVFLLDNDTLFVAGMFTNIGGVPRNGLAAIDAATGTILPWDPNAASYFDGNSLVYSMVRTGDTVFLGGTFTEMGGQSRTGLASVDAYTGALSSWNPGTDNSTVYSLLIKGSTLFVGGAFESIGGQARSGLAAVETHSGEVSPWNPVLTAWDVIGPRVRALAIVDSVLYFGGSFGSLDAQQRVCLGSVHTGIGGATDWDPGIDGLVWSLLASQNSLFVGGGFSRAGSIPADDLVAFTLAPTPEPPPHTLELASCFPSPARTSTQIRFGLPRAAAVTLSIHDVQGRLVAAPLRNSALSAGEHVVQVSTQSWGPGVYFYRLECAGRSMARKMVVVK